MGIDNIIDKSKLHKAVISFFMDNPASIDTTRGIATWVRGDYEEVRSVLDEFTDLGVLTSHKSSSTTGYGLTEDPDMLSKIKKSLKG